MAETAEKVIYKKLNEIFAIKESVMIVSFCVIAYNEEKTIKSLLNDICKQDYPHEKIEVILVDSMSTDSTKKFFVEFSEQRKDFLNVRVLENPKRIQAAGWNVAISAAVGEIIMRIDAHTMIPADFVSKNVRCMQSGEKITGGPRPNIAEEDTPWTHTLLLAESSMFGSSIAPFRKGHHKAYVKSVFHGAYRKEVFEKAGLFNERLGRTEDNEMHYRIRKAGYRICYNPEIVSYQHVRNTWRKMIIQKYGNGYWIGLTLGICPKCFSVYHFVPAIFVLSIIIFSILAMFGISLLLKILLVIYAIINIIMSIFAIAGQKKYKYYILLPIIFLSLHLAYGIGTLWGIIKMPFWVWKGKTD